MYFIQASMSGTLSAIPPVLPPYIYEQAKSGSDAVVSHATGSSTTFSPSLTGGFSNRPLQQQYTGQGILQPQYTGQPMLQPQGTGQRTAPAIPARSTNISNISNISTTSPFGVLPQPTGQQWDVTSAEKASADSYFDTLDASKRGFIEGDVAVPFMLQSKLPDDVLARIW
jgi:epidermal growth factor receptor substrate 15